MIVCVLIAVGPLVYGAEDFVFNQNLRKAYQHLWALRIYQADVLLAEERQRNPNNPALSFVENYQFFLDGFINENHRNFQDGSKYWHQRFEHVKRGNSQSPWYRFCQAELLIHQATLRFKFREYIKGAANIREAYQLLAENARKYPNFRPNMKSMGMLEVLVGTIPSSYSWATSMLGMSGSIEGGMKKMLGFVDAENLLIEEELFKEEALFLFAYMQLHVAREKEAAWNRIEPATRDYGQNLLKCYIRASIGMQCKRTDEVIRTLSNRPTGKDFPPFYFLDYLLGQAKLQRGDANADFYLKRFVAKFRGENYFKDAYLKLAWHAHLQGDEEKYKQYILLVKNKGKAQFDEDKQALKEAALTAPLLPLLRGRLFFDGGYYERAIAEMKQLKPEMLRNEREKVEWHYRMGRAYDEFGNKELALWYYEKAIAEGKSKEWYFAANASIQSGEIYEQKNEIAKAKLSYEAVATMPFTEYRNSLEAKAKAALGRLNEGRK